VFNYELTVREITKGEVRIE